MAKVKVNHAAGKFALSGPKDTDLEGIDDNTYNVFTEDTKLAKAQTDFPNYTWFVSYTIEYKAGGNVAQLPNEYTITFNKPDRDDSKLYYYLSGSGNNKGSVHEVGYASTTSKG